jgi:aspartyl-tRNA(Asn)/glutamyl-tRNA(Gln) amidotransferase subunit A
VQSQSAVLRLIQPDLQESVLNRAGSMLDDVAAYLNAVDARSLDGAFPGFVFDPAAVSSYLPQPVDHPSHEPAASISLPDVQELPWASPTDIARLVRAGDLTAAEVAELYARRIEDWQPEVNAFIDVTLEDAAPPQMGALAAAPVGLTDLIDVAGLPTTAGSAVMHDRIAAADADCWSSLARVGAVLAGKLNVQEFAAGTTGENARFGWTRNPWDTTRMTGGACGGAGAAVAAGMVSAALGPDPGGSIRVPAAHCGVVALKPTYGAISRQGVLPLTWTLDAVGVMAQRVRGVAGVADHLLIPHAPHNRRGSYEGAALAGERTASLDLTLGIPVSWLDMGLDPEVRVAFEKALEHLTDLGAKVREVDVPYAGDILKMHRAIAFSEASASHEPFLLHQADGIGANIRDREEAGRAMLAGQYLKAFRIRAMLCRRFSEVWRDVDLVVTPTVPVPPAPIGTQAVTTSSRGPEPTHTVYTRYLAPFSSLGLPTLSVPCGATTGGLPIGMQLAGPPHAESLLFYAAGAYEASTVWHTQHPVLSR